MTFVNTTEIIWRIKSIITFYVLQKSILSATQSEINQNLLIPAILRFQSLLSVTKRASKNALIVKFHKMGKTSAK